MMTIRELMVESAIKSVDGFCTDAAWMALRVMISHGHIFNAHDMIDDARLILWTFERPTIMPEVLSARGAKMAIAKADCRYVLKECGESEADLAAYLSDADNHFGDGS